MYASVLCLYICIFLLFLSLAAICLSGIRAAAILDFTPTTTTFEHDSLLILLPFILLTCVVLTNTPPSPPQSFSSVFNPFDVYLNFKYFLMQRNCTMVFSSILFLVFTAICYGFAWFFLSSGIFCLSEKWSEMFTYSRCAWCIMYQACQNPNEVWVDYFGHFSVDWSMHCCTAIWRTKKNVPKNSSKRPLKLARPALRYVCVAL